MVRLPLPVGAGAHIAHPVRPLYPSLTDAKHDPPPLLWLPPGAACSTADASREEGDHPQKGGDDGEHEEPFDRESQAEEQDGQNGEQDENKHASPPFADAFSTPPRDQQTTAA